MGSTRISQRVMRKMRVAQENEDEMYVIIGDTRVEKKIAWKRWIDISSTLRGLWKLKFDWIALYAKLYEYLNLEELKYLNVIWIWKKQFNYSSILPV